MLAEDPGALCSRHQILDSVWDPHWYGPTKTSTSTSRTCGASSATRVWIETVRGVGYRLRDPETAG